MYSRSYFTYVQKIRLQICIGMYSTAIFDLYKEGFTSHSSSGSCLDPNLPGTGLELRARKGEGRLRGGLAQLVGRGWQLESSKDGENMTIVCVKPILDTTQQSQRPVE
jgi:hypothetical protein